MVRENGLMAHRVLKGKEDRDRHFSMHSAWTQAKLTTGGLVMFVLSLKSLDAGLAPETIDT